MKKILILSFAAILATLIFSACDMSTGTIILPTAEPSAEASTTVTATSSATTPMPTTPTEIVYTEGLEFVPATDGESYEVSGIGTVTDTEIFIPPTYEGKPVTGIAKEAFKNCRSIKSVTVPVGVTVIGESAFRGCSALSSVYLSDSVTTIGSEAFRSCLSINNIVIPKGVTTVGDGAFAGCIVLLNVFFENTAGWSSGSVALDVTDSEKNALNISQVYMDAWTRS